MEHKTPVLASKQTCTGCLACVDACPKHAISKCFGEDGHIYVRIDNQACVGCLKCQGVCSKIHDGTYSDNEKISAPYSAYSKNADLYDKATSGGIFPEIANWFLNQGWPVFGAAYIDGIHVAHVEVCQKKDLSSLQGSKYVQSDMSGVYRQIKAHLDNGTNVLFSGTGCQVAAVLAYFDRHPNRQNLFTMDVVCGGVPSSLLMDTFVKNEKPSVKSIAYFRQKEKYSFAYVSRDNQIVKCARSLPLDGFKSSLTNRFSCYDCEFSGIHRKSDWTIGDFWGNEDKEHCKSLCICHSERARQIFDGLSVQKDLLLDWNFAICNPRLVNGKCPFANRLERRCVAWLFKRCSYKTLRKIYAADVKKYDVLGIIYKAYRLIRFKNYFKNSRKIVGRIVK